MSNRESLGPCYCNIWETDPSSLVERGIPPGFCGICDECGAPGHLRHYPGPVPNTASWCDTCYIVEAHLSPDRVAGAWFFDADTWDEVSLAETDVVSDKQRLFELLSKLAAPRSALIITLAGPVGIDFVVQTDLTLRTRYAQWTKGRFVETFLDDATAAEVLNQVLANRDVRDFLLTTGSKFTFYDDDTGDFVEFPLAD